MSSLSDSEGRDILREVEDTLFVIYDLTIQEARELEETSRLTEPERQLLHTYQEINRLIKGEDMVKRLNPPDLGEFKHKVPKKAIIPTGTEFLEVDDLTGWFRPNVASTNIVQGEDLRERWTRTPLSPPPPPPAPAKLPTRAPACITNISVGLLPGSPLSKWDYGYLHEDGSWMLFCTEGIGFYIIQAEYIQSFKVVYPEDLSDDDLLAMLA